MKLKHFFLFLFAANQFISCAQTSNSDNVISETKNCYRTVAFGDIDICLPEIDGMIECITTHPNIKSYTDDFVAQTNSDLAFYIEEEKFEVVKDFDKDLLDLYGLGANYFKIYVLNEIEGVKFSSDDLKKMESMSPDMGKIMDNNDDLNRLEELKNLSIGEPVNLGRYNTDKDAISLVYLNKIRQANSEDVFQCMILNFLRIKNRLFCLALYNKYDGKESIQITKNKNDYIILSLLSKNR